MSSAERRSEAPSTAPVSPGSLADTVRRAKEHTDDDDPWRAALAREVVALVAELEAERAANADAREVIANGIVLYDAKCDELAVAERERDEARGQVASLHAALERLVEVADLEIVGYTACKACRAAHDEHGEWWTPGVTGHDEDCPLSALDVARTALAVPSPVPVSEAGGGADSADAGMRARGEA